VSTPDRPPFAGRGCFKPLGSFTPGSLQNRIRQFFIANPDEELTYRDMAVKFDCTTEQAQGAVRELIKRDGTLYTQHVVRFKAPERAAA
jgi:hypothetical protein